MHALFELSHGEPLQEQSMVELIEFSKGSYAFMQNLQNLGLEAALSAIPDITEAQKNMAIQFSTTIKKNSRAGYDLNQVLNQMLTNLSRNNKLSENDKKLYAFMALNTQYTLRYLNSNKSLGATQVLKSCNLEDIAVDAITGLTIYAGLTTGFDFIDISGIPDIISAGASLGLNPSTAIAAGVAVAVSAFINCWGAIKDFFEGVVGWVESILGGSPDCDLPNSPTLSLSPIDCSGKFQVVVSGGFGDDIVSYSWNNDNTIPSQVTTGSPTFQFDVVDINQPVSFELTATCSDGTPIPLDLSVFDFLPSDLITQISTPLSNNLEIVEIDGSSYSVTLCNLNGGNSVSNGSWSSSGGTLTTGSHTNFNNCQTIKYYFSGSKTINYCEINECTGGQNCTSIQVSIP